MFIEPHITGAKRGWIEVICGSMFSGKTEELIRRLKRAGIANQRIEIYKPAVDTRYRKGAIVSHDENSIASIQVDHARAIVAMTQGADVIAIDEAQFFDDELSEVCNRLAFGGARVIVAGLDMDYAGKPFGPLPALLSTAEYITKLHAICVKCGNIANYSWRKTDEGNQILIGEKEMYEPRCRHCFQLKD